MMNSNSTAATNVNRRAQRSYHCYACQNEWRQLVNLNDISDVTCSACSSEFFEESKSYHQAVAEASSA